MGHRLVSLETRQHVVSLLQQGFSYLETSKALNIGTATVTRVWRQYRETGQVKKARRKGGQFSPIDAKGEELLTRLVKMHPTSTSEELTAAWCKATKKRVSRSAISRKLKSLGFSRKKASQQALEKKTKKNAAKRAMFRFRRKSFSPEKLVFLDESGFQSKLKTTHGWAYRGEQVTVFDSTFPSKNYTMVGAIRLSGPVLMHGSSRSMTTKRFYRFLKTRLLPRLRPGDILVMDNLAAHRNKVIRKLCRLWNVSVCYLPPYSPEYNPIENVWAWMKARIRRRTNRAQSCFRYAVAGAWRKVANLRMENLFRNAGYLPSCQVI